MTVSVVIATYNRPAMVRQTLEAVLGQSRPPEEIVVVDDASTDATWEELGKFAASWRRLRMYRRETNSGGIAAWNEAAARARGQAIAFCTDDDRFLPRHLEASLDYLERHPETGLVHSGFIDAMETGEKEWFEPRKLRAAGPIEITRGNLAAYMTRYYDWPVHPSTLVLRREVWERTGGFNPAYTLADTDWFVRAIERYPAALLPRHGVYNRRHAGNWSNRVGSARMQREIFEIVEALLDRLYRERSLKKAAWKTVWRANARLHLLLTLAARLKTGREQAACAAWHGVLHDTGRRFPAGLEQRLERAGVSLIRLVCRRRCDHAANRRESVSPL